METIITGNKTYRFEQNPLEKQLHDDFADTSALNMSRVAFGSLDGDTPSDFVNEREQSIMISTIQWLGSPMGQAFLREHGFHRIPKKDTNESIH